MYVATEPAQRRQRWWARCTRPWAFSGTKIPYTSRRQEVSTSTEASTARSSPARAHPRTAGELGKPGALVLAPDGRMVMGISAPCDVASRVGVLGGDRVVQARRKRRRGLCPRHSRTGRSCLLPADERPVRDDEQRDDLDPQTPGDWLAVVHQDEAWGFPDCYGQGGTVCTGVPQPVAALDAHAAVSGVAIVTDSSASTIGTAAIVAEWAEGKGSESRWRRTARAMRARCGHSSPV